MIRLRLKRTPDGRIDRDDAGSTLILVLVFVSFFSILIGGLLTMVDTSFKEVVAIRGQRHATYAAESGLEAAIAYIRSSPTQGVTGNCNDVTATGVNGQIVVVRCTPDSDSGLVQPGDDAQSLPRHALLTIDTDADTPSRGLNLNSGGLHVDGPLFSNSQVRLGGGASLTVTNGGLNARAGCTGGTISPACATTSTVEDDPQYPPAATTFTLTNPPPVCAGDTATFAPGRYTQTPEALISATPGCVPNTITTEMFPAAVSPTVAAYYFNFPGSGTSARWQTSRRIRVGSDAATGACTVGAQMIFGGGSWMDLQQNSLLHVCAYKPATGQRIGIYGAGSVVRLRPTSTATSGSGTGSAFTPTTTATVRNFDSQHSTGTVSALNAHQSFTMGGFRQGWNGGPLSASGSLTSAKIRIRHSESEINQNRMRVSVTVAPSDGSTPFMLVSGSCGSIPNCAAALSLSTSMHEDSYELTQSSPGWTSPTRFNGATVTYTVINTQSGTNVKTGRLDGVWLDVVYAPPGLTAASGRVLTGADFLMNTPNTSDSDVKVTGTLYAPAAQVNLNLGLACDQALSRGAIVWRLNASLTGSCTPVSSPISLPGSTSGITNDRVVVLESYVGCVPASCPAKIRARVRFPASGAVPVVERWTVIKQ